MPWTYEPDEDPKEKHHWANQHAGFETDRDGELVGKCPSGLSLKAAEDLINSEDRAIEWRPRGWRRRYPQRIYVIHNGVLYRATPTNPEVSYHGFPAHSSRFPKRAQKLRKEILRKARELECEPEVKEWMGW
jgi:hypothetical protein